ncbi:MAG: precorrin-3B C(17)-methyltransferase [Actinomycetota bacterium]
MTDTPVPHPPTTDEPVAALTVSITEAGADLARRLPYAHHHGDLAATVRERWADTDAFVLVCAVGIAVRVVGPLLADKADDPIVVAVDDGGRFAVPVCGGHRGANELAVDVAALLDAEPVVTTATDARSLPALDTLPGFTAVGDIAAVTRALLDGEPVALTNDLDWPLPAALADRTSAPGGAAARITVTDRAVGPEPGEVVLHPPSLVVGVGASTDAPATAAIELLSPALAAAGLARASVATLATIDRRADDPVATAVGLPVVSFTAADLAPVAVPNPSEVVAAEVGTPSVGEAAALLAAGPGAELVVEKTKGATATVSVARRAHPPGEVTVVGLGPGHAKHRTPEAAAAVRSADVVIGYGFYVDQVAELCSARQEVVRSPIGAEVDRCIEAVRRASEGQRVTLVCSGDSGVFAMATLVFEVAPRHGNPPIQVVPGVTASLAAAAILGAPLAHDHALVSLSDLLTPWPLIERRLEALAASDMAVAFYNPRSQRRITQLERARQILLTGRPATTPVGVVVNATRPGERVLTTTLGELDAAEVDMFSIVVVGSSTTTLLNGRMVTPRGYDS